MLRPSTARPGSDAPTLIDEQTFKRLIRRASRTLLVALGVPLLILAALVLWLQDSAGWVDHTDKVISEGRQAGKLLVVMQTSFRGYRLSGVETMLGPYHRARADIWPQLERIASLVADNDRQSEVVRGLRGDLAAWFAFLDDQFAGIGAGRVRVNDPSFMVAGAPLFDRTEAQLERLIAEEERLRVARTEALDRTVNVVMGGFALAVLLGIPFLLWWLQRLLRRTDAAYRASLAEVELRANELSVTLRSIGDAVIATDARGRVDFLNPVAEALMGWSMAEARGRPLADVFVIFNETTGVPVENPVERVLREHVVVGLANHTVLRARDGTERPIEDSAAPIRDAGGALFGVILVFHDVSLKRQDERRLEASEAHLRFLNELADATRPLGEPEKIMAVTARLLGAHLRASRCAYAEVAEDGDRFTILHDYTDGCASSAGEYRLSAFGARADRLRQGEPLVIRDVADELAPDDGAATFAALAIRAIVCFSTLKSGRLRAMMAVHQIGPRVWTPAELSLIGDVVTRCWESIERARAEQAAHAATRAAEAAARLAEESAERFRLLAETIALQVWTARPEGRLNYANQECANYFGVDVEREVLGDGWTQFVHPDDLATAGAAWQKSLATGERYQTEFRLRDHQGAYRWFLVRATAMRDAAGAIIRWFGTNTEIDELKRARAEAEQANQAKDDFIAALSHELRTPLTPALLIAASLRVDERLPVDAREQLGLIERNIALEARLIDDLLDLTAIVRGKLRFRPQPCDAHSLINFAVGIVKEDAQAKAITIALDFGAAHRGITADPARFQQVIWNILRNAVKFTPPGGRITVRTGDEFADDGTVWLGIVITDSGIGIPPGELEKIFQPFEQGGLVGDHRFGGIGLGLAIARAIVLMHGGRISARSEGLHQGATFVVQLPGARPIAAVLGDEGTSPARGPAGPDNHPPTSPVAARSLRLLVVEDHESTLRTMTLLLTRSGHAVVPAANVAAALQAAREGTFDLVISDLGLPDGTGFELMARLRAAHGLRGIALSGYGMADDIARSHEAGFVTHLTKPVDMAQLRRVLDDWA